MSIRCANCRGSVSEWAAWCPTCGFTFADSGSGVAADARPDVQSFAFEPRVTVAQLVSQESAGGANDGLAFMVIPGPQFPRPPATACHQALLPERSGAIAPPRVSLGGPRGNGGGQLPRPSPLFARMVPLGPVGLGTAIEAWWTAGARAGFVTVRRRLRLGPPSGDASTRWTMTGRFWHSTHLHSVPVVLELWPLYEGFARMTLTPRGHVFASRRYFRAGHSVLDHLSMDLASAST